MRLRPLFRLTPAAGAICLLGQFNALAQTATALAAPASAPVPTGVYALSTIVVSGSRATRFTSNVVGVGAFRDQAPVDVPRTNSVITRDVLDAQSAKSVMDVVRDIAGVTRSQTDNAANKSYWSAADATSANPIIAAGLPPTIRAAAQIDV